MDKQEFKIGDTFKHGRKEYEVLGIFEEEGKIFYWCRTTTANGLTTYSNIFTYDDEGKLYQRS